MDSLTEIIAAVENKDNSYLDDYADLEEPGSFISTIDKVSSIFVLLKIGFPLGLEKWEGIFQSGKNQRILNRLEKVRENHTKYLNFGQILFVIF